jgi:hypothetical protein
MPGCVTAQCVTSTRSHTTPSRHAAGTAIAPSYLLLSLQERILYTLGAITRCYHCDCCASCNNEPQVTLPLDRRIACVCMRRHLTDEPTCRKQHWHHRAHRVTLCNTHLARIWRAGLAIHPVTAAARAHRCHGFVARAACLPEHLCAATSDWLCTNIRGCKQHARQTRAPRLLRSGAFTK